MESSKLLKSFTSYCEGNPEQRFWQCLCNWSKAKAIYMLKNSCPTEIDDMLMYWCDDNRKNIQLADTFYYEDKNK